MSVSIAVATRSDVPAVAALLANTLAGDSVFAQLLPAGQRRHRAAAEFFAAYASTHLGASRAVDVARDQAGTVVGVAVWTFRSAGNSTNPLRQLGRTRQYLRSIGWRGVMQGVRLRRETERRRPFGSHWWLSALATHPKARRQGIATALIESRLAGMDQREEPAYVEVTDTLATGLLTKLGFRAHNALGHAPRYPAQPMTREPARSLRRYD